MTDPTELVLAEYHELREDERHYKTLTLTLVAILLTVVAALGAVFVVSNTPRGEVSTWVYGFAPVLPIGVFAFVAGNARSAAFRTHYMREVEKTLFFLYGRQFSPRGFPIPSSAHADHRIQWTGQGNRVWWVVDVSAATTFGGLTFLPVLLANLWWLQIGLGVLYGVPFAFLLSVYIRAYRQGGKPFAMGALASYQGDISSARDEK